MSVIVGSNSITGITTAVNDTDAAYVEYVDGKLNFPSLSGNEGKYLVTDGSTPSFKAISTKEFEYTIPGSYTLNIPSDINDISITAIGGGGGGGNGVINNTTDVPTINWSFRTTGFVNQEKIRINQNLEYPYFNTGFNRTVAASKNTITWYSRTIGASSSSKQISEIGTSDSLYFIFHTSSASNTAAEIRTSTDSIVWKVGTTGVRPSGGGLVNAFLYVPSATEPYVIAGGSTYYSTNSFYRRLSVSTDSIVWTARTIPNTGGIVTSLAFGNNIYVAGTYNGAIYTSTDSTVWTSRTTGLYDGLFTTNELNHIIYGNNNYVAVGKNGLITTSTDAITWELRTSGSSNSSPSVDLYKIIYDGNRYFTTGMGEKEYYEKCFITSTDTIVWESVFDEFASSTRFFSGIALGPPTSETFGGVSYYYPGVQIYDIDYSNRKYGLVYQSGNKISISPSVGVVYQFKNTFVASSSDISGSGGGAGALGKFKIPRSLISGSTLTIDVAYGGTANNPGTATTISWNSTLGISSITIPGGSGGGFKPGLGGVINDTRILEEVKNGSDGKYGISVPASDGIVDIGNESFAYLLGSQYIKLPLPISIDFNQPSGGGGGALISDDLRTSCLSGIGASVIRNGLSYNSGADEKENITGTFQNLGPNGSGGAGGSCSSPGAYLNFTERVSNFGSDLIYDLIYGNSVFVASGSSGKLNTSTDGITWIIRTSGQDSYINALLYENNTYLSGGFGVISSSTDAIVWTFRTSGLESNPIQINSLIYGNNNYVAVGENGVINVSTDAISWELRTSGVGANTLWEISYGNNTYVSGGDLGILITSTDTISWELRTSGVGTNGIYSTLYANNRYVAAGNSSSLISSTDAISWELRTTRINTTDVTWIKLLYADNEYIVCGGGNNRGEISNSTDAISWISIQPSIDIINRISFGDNRYVLSILNSSDIFTSVTSNSGFTGNGAPGYRGGGGGGGSVNLALNSVGTGGKGGDGYVNISWS